MFHISRTSLALVCACAFATAHAAGPTGSAADYGTPAPAAAGQRTIILEPGTRHINVTRGETVTIEQAGQRFSWHVDTWGNRSMFALAEIAPTTMAVGGIKVYVAANPFYAGS